MLASPQLLRGFRAFLSDAYSKPSNVWVGELKLLKTGRNHFASLAVY